MCTGIDKKIADIGIATGQIGPMRFALFNRGAPEPTHVDVRHGDSAFRVELRRRPMARRVTLRISGATGDIVMTLPERTSSATAKKFAEAHGGWIAARVSRLPHQVPFATGAVVPFRGMPHRVVRRASLATRAGPGPEGESEIVVSGGKAQISRRLREFLYREARCDLEEAVGHYTSRLGVQAQKITLRDTTSRWGSCSSRGGLSFSWRLIMAPPFVLDYLAAHEAAHLVEMNHSHRFWRIVHDMCPRTEEAEKWLKQNGAGLHRFG